MCKGMLLCRSAPVITDHLNLLTAGTLITEIAKDAVEAAMHKQGTYALQKVLESPCTASEFVALGNELLKSGQELLGGEPGIYVMAKLVEQLVSMQVCFLFVTQYAV